MTLLDYAGLWVVAGLCSYLFALNLERKEYGEAFYFKDTMINILSDLLSVAILWPIHWIRYFISFMDLDDVVKFLTKERRL